MHLAENKTSDVEKRWGEFISETSAEAITAGDFLDPDDLVALYLQTKPPFEPKEDKKAEFPDAIALLQLEAWGEQHQKYVLAVSRDGGWTAFAASAKWVIVREDLPSALGLFHRADGYVVQRIVSMLDDPQMFVLAEELESEISRFVDNINPDIDAHSYLHFDVDFQGAGYEGRRDVDPETVAVINADDASITLAFPLVIDAEISAEFSFSVHDSIDDDYVPMGGTEVTRTVGVNVQVVVQMAREAGPNDDPQMLKIEAPRFVSVDFGQVEPDFHRYDNE